MVIQFIAGWSSLVARRAHNPKVVGSNPAPATNSNAKTKHCCAQGSCTNKLPSPSYSTTFTHTCNPKKQPAKYNAIKRYELHC